LKPPSSPYLCAAGGMQDLAGLVVHESLSGDIDLV